MVVALLVAVLLFGWCCWFGLLGLRLVWCYFVGCFVGLDAFYLLAVAGWVGCVICFAVAATLAFVVITLLVL